MFYKGRKIKMTQKEAALSNMVTLKIHKPYIEKFEKDGTVTLFEACIGYYVGEYNQFTEIKEMIDRIEKSHGVVIYAVTHEKTRDLDMYSMLFIPKDERYFEETLTLNPDGSHTAWAIVYTANAPWDPEEGDIGIKSLGGGIRRVW